MSERYIWVRNWKKFQHYGDRRNPVWIKSYVELLHDDAYLGLTLHQRGVLHGLWLSFAAARRRIPDSTSTVSRRLGQRVTRETLDSLSGAGFIEIIASGELSRRELLAMPEKEKEEDKEPPYPPQEGDDSVEEEPRTLRAAGTNPRAVQAARAQEHRLASFVQSFFDEYPNSDDLVSELVDRGATQEEALALIATERLRRESEAA